MDQERVWSSRTRPDHEGDYRSSAGSHPSGVRANVARLHAAKDIAHITGRSRAFVNRTVDNVHIDRLPEDRSGEGDDRLDNRGSIEFVDVILVRQRGVEATHALGVLGGKIRAFVI